MNKVKVWIIIAIGMMVVNLIILAFLFLGRPGPPKEEGPRRMVIEKLGLDKTQVAQYDKLIEQHKKDIEAAQNTLRSLKNKLFTTLQTEVDDSIKDELITEIGQAQIEIEQIHYSHFQQLKAICKPAQMEAFDEICLDIAKWFAPPPPKRR